MRYRIPVLASAFVLILSACKDPAGQASIPYGNLIPLASSFGPDCRILAVGSDKWAIEMAEGTYTPTPNDGRRVGDLTAFFVEPRFTLAVRPQYDAESAAESYESRFAQQFQGDESLDAELLAKVGAGGATRRTPVGLIGMFRYGNVIVEVMADDPATLKAVAEALETHYRGAAR